MAASDELFYLSATSLAKRIKDRKITSRAVVDAHIGAVERINPLLNAIVKSRFDEARAEADAADARTADLHPDDLPTFHGVPCTVKESFALTGMPNSAGLVARADLIASEDATAVDRMRRAGLIPIGVTNTSELCMWMESDNKVYGRTNNPYDPTRIVGGSSGGEGAIVGSGASPLGVGSDVGGSIRMPAFFNGVFGHKSTGGLVPNTGQYPLAHGPSARYCVTGPITRRAEDLYPTLALMAGPDGKCPGARDDLRVIDPASVDLRRLEVLNIPDDGRLPVSGSLRAAQARVVDHLRARGVRVRDYRPKQLVHGLEMWSACLTAAGQPYAELLGNGDPVNGFAALADFVRGRSPYTLPSIALVILEGIVKAMEDDTARFVAMKDELYADLEREVGPDAVFLYPSHAWTAPRHRVPLLVPVLWVYTAALNVLEVPVTQVPLGLDADGVPLGIQVGALQGGDHRTIAVALELERAFGGWVRPALAA